MNIPPISRTPSPAMMPYEHPQVFEQRSFWRFGATLYIRPLTRVARDIPLEHRAVLCRMAVPYGSPAVVTVDHSNPPVRYLVGWVKGDLVHWHVARRHGRTSVSS